MNMLKFFLFIGLSIGIMSCGDKAQSQTATLEKFTSADYTGDIIEKSDAEWKNILSEDTYNVLRKNATEPAFSSDLLKEKREGTYVCGGCGLTLFSSDTKFKSGTGWPSFYAPMVNSHIGYRTDSSYGMDRIEVHCPRCGGHLGHVFKDGPQPTGLRYCLNGDALDFESE